MSGYYDKIGYEFKEGDICFYSEYDGINNSFHYADGIYEVVNINGLLYMKCRVITMDNARNFIEYDDKFEQMLTLKESCMGREDSNELLIIGNVRDNRDMITREYAMDNFQNK